MALEFVPDGSLLDLLGTERKLSEKKAKPLVRQIAGSLQYLHEKRVIHRDLKLENILLDGERVVLVDFGLSGNWYLGKIMKTHCGSAEYAAPELFRKYEHYGPKIDVWSFGVIIYRY